ncbi:hypothetical protein, partial [Collinsella sp. D33t1_170424_A12]|uniref:hypothetical protein n=1 Tax=Collinsella sp. D33t1_170424_A12 TaxID=2787135 RepID=UPI001E31B4D9
VHLVAGRKRVPRPAAGMIAFMAFLSTILRVFAHTTRAVTHIGCRTEINKLVFKKHTVLYENCHRFRKNAA